MIDDLLMLAIKKALSDLEMRGDIVVCSEIAGGPAKYLHDAVSAFVPNSALTYSELSGIRSLIFHAVDDERFFDWEMPTLTGFNADGFRKIAEKLPTG